MARRQGNRLAVAFNRRQLLRFGSGTLLALSAAPLLAACSIVTRRQRFNVTMSGPDPTMFIPGSLTIPLGATVVWKNNGIYPHTATCQPAQGQGDSSYAKLPEGAQPLNSRDLYPGQAWSYTFTTAGEFVYVSRRDQTGHMLGTITVTG